MRRWIPAAVAALLVAAALIIAFGYLKGERATHVRPGQEAPDVELAAVEGPAGRLRQNLGSATIVVFMDTRWPEMERYVASLERLYRKYQRRGLRVVAICLDESKDAARAFIHERAITFTVLHDPGGRATQAAWGRPDGPESYVLDASGRIVEAFPHPVNWMLEDRQALAERLLPSPSPGSW